MLFTIHFAYSLFHSKFLFEIWNFNSQIRKLEISIRTWIHDRWVWKDAGWNFYGLQWAGTGLAELNFKFEKWVEQLKTWNLKESKWFKSKRLWNYMTLERILRLELKVNW